MCHMFGYQYCDGLLTVIRTIYKTNIIMIEYTNNSQKDFLYKKRILW